MSETWTLNDCTLYLGDCPQVLALLPPQSANAMITDPPYCSGGSLEAQKNTKAQGLRTATVNDSGFSWFTNDNMGTAGLVWLLRSVVVSAANVLTKNSSSLVFTDWRMVPNLAPAIESSGMRYRNMLVWDKGSAGLGSGFKPAHEIILEFTNGVTQYNARTGQNVIRVPRVHGTEKEHGAQKPIRLIEQLIDVVSCPGDTILDPFTGSGTTGVACVRTGRKFIGIEKEPKYFEIAKRRITEAYESQALLAGANT